MGWGLCVDDCGLDFGHFGLGVPQGIDFDLELHQIRGAHHADVALFTLGIEDTHDGNGGDQCGDDVVQGIECGGRRAARFWERITEAFRVGIDLDAWGLRGGS